MKRDTALYVKRALVNDYHRFTRLAGFRNPDPGDVRMLAQIVALLDQDYPGWRVEVKV